MRPFRHASPDHVATRLTGAPGVVDDPTRAVPDATAGLRALARAIGAHPPAAFLTRPPDPAAEECLEGAIRLLCDQARAVDAEHAERLLIALKRAWNALPEVQRIPSVGHRTALWDRVVALCVEEFYAPRLPGPAATPCTEAATTRPD